MSVNPKRTPCYSVNLEQVKKNYDLFSSAIKAWQRDDLIAYSVKANYNQAIIQTLNDLNSYFEVCSEYEYAMLTSYGIQESKIIVNGCFFNDFKKYERCHLMILDSENQFCEWVKTGCKQSIGIRVNLDYFTGREGDDRFNNKTSRFGMDFRSSEIANLLKKANKEKITALHCHLAGNNRKESIYGDIVEQLQKVAHDHNLNKVKWLDVGGGFKIARDSSDYDGYVRAVNNICEKDKKVIYEPGNALVRTCADYWTKVIDIKKTGNRTFAIVDGSSLQLPKIQNNTKEYEIKSCEEAGEMQHVSFFCGNTCKESDVLLNKVENCDVKKGDFLILKNVGAYGMNEINKLILGSPHVCFSDDTKIMLGDYSFERICKCKKCIVQNGRNDYSIINKKASGRGLYAFVKQDVILYIGVAVERDMSARIKQHLRKNDSGGLSQKLNKKQFAEVEESDIYVCKLSMEKQDLLFAESFLIGTYKPKFNYLG